MGLVTQSNLKIESLPGIWRCRYWFPSNNHPGKDVSDYYVRIERQDGSFILHSLPNKSGSYIQARFTVESNLATGTWLEDTSPTGDFKGLLYSGAFQLLISEAAKSLSGCWVGVGRGDGRPKIYEGRWEITYAAETAEGLPEL